MPNLLKPGSLLLVSGANGYIASHVCNEALAAGYRVRGTVRDPQKTAWLQEYFDAKHGKGKFELAKVEDIAAEGAFDQALKGCQGFAHVASDTSFSSDPNKVVPLVLKATENAIKACLNDKDLKSFVLTSSSFAVTMPKPNKKFNIDASMWNEEAVEKAWAPPPYEASRGAFVYAASKTQGEQLAWKMVKENNAHFTFNTVNPNGNFGPVLCPEHQKGSTAALIRACFSQEEFDKSMKGFDPQHGISVIDTARLHVALLTDLDLKNQRVLGLVWPLSPNSILEFLRKEYSEKKDVIAKNIEDQGEDVSTPEKTTGEKILKERFGHGWTSFETSIKQNADAWVR